MPRSGAFFATDCLPLTAALIHVTVSLRGRALPIGSQVRTSNGTRGFAVGGDSDAGAEYPDREQR